MNKADRSETYKTIDLVVVVFLIIFYFSGVIVFLLIGIALLLINLLYVEASQVFTFYWLKFAAILGKINSTILLSIIFIFFLTPLAFFYRIFNPSKVDKFKNGGKKSFFESVNKTIRKKNFINQW